MAHTYIGWLSPSFPKEHACLKAWGKNGLEILMNTTRLVLVFASVVLLAWEVKNECPSHMTLLYQQKLCRNNYADRRFCWLSLYHSEKPNWQQKNSSCLLSHFHSGSPMANAHTQFCIRVPTPASSHLFHLSSNPNSSLSIIILFILHADPSVFMSSFCHLAWFFFCHRISTHFQLHI